jgi:sugar phosphate isomerase/epimerase
MDRRDFLRSGAALAASAAVRFRGAAPRRMTIALTPGSIGVEVKGQRELLDLAQRHGFESVEPRAAELAGCSDAQLGELAAELRGKKLSWAAAGLPVEFRRDDAAFRSGMERLPKLAEGLRRAGASRVGTWIMPSHDELPYTANFRRHAERLREAAKVLGDRGLRLGLEYVGTRHLLLKGRYPFVHTLAETRELIAEIGTGNAGLVLDSWHWWTAGDAAAEIRTLRNEDVVSVDLNDAPAGVAREDLQDSRRELPAATGVIDLAGFLNALQAIGYDGPVRPEPFNAALNAMDNEAACAASAAALRKAMALIRE